MTGNWAAVTRNEDSLEQARKAFQQHNNDSSNLDVLERCKRLNEFLTQDFLRKPGQGPNSKAELQQILALLSSGPKRPACLDKPPITHTVGKKPPAKPSTPQHASLKPPGAVSLRDFDADRLLGVLDMQDEGSQVSTRLTSASSSGRTATPPSSNHSSCCPNPVPGGSSPEDVDDLIGLLNVDAQPCHNRARPGSRRSSDSGPQQISQERERNAGGRESEGRQQEDVELQQKLQCEEEKRQLRQQQQEEERQRQRQAQQQEEAEQHRRAQQQLKEQEQQRREEQLQQQRREEERRQEVQLQREKEQQQRAERQQEEERQRREEAQRQQELQQRQEEEQRRLQQQEEERRRQEQLQQQAEERRRQEQLQQQAEERQRQELQQAEERRRQEQLQQQAEEQRRQEQLQQQRLAAALQLQAALRALLGRHTYARLRALHTIRRSCAARSIQAAWRAWASLPENIWKLGPVRAASAAHTHRGPRPFSADPDTLLAQPVRLRAPGDTRSAPQHEGDNSRRVQSCRHTHRTVSGVHARSSSVRREEAHQRGDVATRAVMAASKHRDTAAAIEAARRGSLKS